MDAKRFVMDYLRYSPAPVETLFAAAAELRSKPRRNH